MIDAKPDPVSAMIYGGMASPAFMATQVDIIQSDRVAQRVVRNLKLAENPQVRAAVAWKPPRQGSIETWLADTLPEAAWTSSPRAKSTSSRVATRRPTRSFAAAPGQRLRAGLPGNHPRTARGPGQAVPTFFDTRAKEARESAGGGAGQVSAFQRDKGIIATDERLDIENARLNELSSQLVALQAMSSESGSRQAQAQGGAADRMQEVLNNALIVGLKADLLAQRGAAAGAERRAWATTTRRWWRPRPTSPSLRSRIDAETRRVTGGVGVSEHHQPPARWPKCAPRWTRSAPRCCA